MRTIDRTGKRYGHLVVMHLGERDKQGRLTWACQCTCGKTVSVRSTSLHKQRSCGCRKSLPIDTLSDISGKRYGALTVVGKSRTQQRLTWECVCDCGNIAFFTRSHLTRGQRTSCGDASHKRSHGMSKTAEYMTWRNAKSRCYNKNNRKYPIYGGRGITLCPEWVDDFDKFFEDMGYRPSPKHSLERKNGDGNYTKENCVWATISEQNNNTKKNVIISYDDQRMTIAEAARLAEVPYDPFYKMVRRKRKELPRGELLCLTSRDI